MSASKSRNSGKKPVDVGQFYRLLCHSKSGVRVDEDLLTGIQTGNLRLQLASYSNESLDVLFQVLARMHDLKSVHLEVSEDVGGARKSGRRLRASLEDAPILRPQSALKLGAVLRLALSRSPSLKSLKFVGLKVHVDFAKCLEKALKDICLELSSIEFVDCDMGDKSFALFAPSIAKNRNITQCIFRNCQLTVKSTGPIAEILKTHTQNRDDIVWARGLRGSGCGTDDWTFSGILTFDCSDNVLGDFIGLSVGRLLQRDTWLKAIRLHNVGLTTSGYTALLDGIKKNKTLVALDVSGNNGADVTIQQRLREWNQSRNWRDAPPAVLEQLEGWGWRNVLTSAIVSTVPVTVPETTVSTENGAMTTIEAVTSSTGSGGSGGRNKPRVTSATPRRTVKKRSSSQNPTPPVRSSVIQKTPDVAGTTSVVSELETTQTVDASFLTARHNTLSPDSQTEEGKANHTEDAQVSELNRKISQLALSKQASDARVTTLEKTVAELKAKLGLFTSKCQCGVAANNRDALALLGSSKESLSSDNDEEKIEYIVRPKSNGRRKRSSSARRGRSNVTRDDFIPICWPSGDASLTTQPQRAGGSRKRESSPKPKSTLAAQVTEVLKSKSSVSSL